MNSPRRSVISLGGQAGYFLGVLFLLFGSSGAGKTYALNELRMRGIADLAIHEFDETGVPAEADTAWRHDRNEAWLRRGLDYQAEGVDLLLAGQTPFGEVLAAKSGPQFEAISACLIDCSDTVREARLRTRGTDWFERAGGSMQDYLNWADWMRHHATDPTWMPEVIRPENSTAEMQWHRWSAWEAGDPRWRVHAVDTTTLPVERVADELVKWIEEERAARDAGVHPLTASALVTSPHARTHQLDHSTFARRQNANAASPFQGVFDVG